MAQQSESPLSMLALQCQKVGAIGNFDQISYSQSSSSVSSRCVPSQIDQGLIGPALFTDLPEHNICIPSSSRDTPGDFSGATMISRESQLTEHYSSQSSVAEQKTVSCKKNPPEANVSPNQQADFINRQSPAGYPTVSYQPQSEFYPVTRDFYGILPESSAPERAASNNLHPTSPFNSHQWLIS